jgi:hypothetical protein
MIDATSARTPSESALRVEARRLGVLLQRYLTHSLNRLFELSASGAGRRRLRFLLAILVICVMAFAAHLLLQFRYRTDAEPLTNLGSLLPVAVVPGLRIVLVLGIAVSAALHVAGRFLADIFELKDARTAWRFVTRLAAGSGEEVLHLREGGVADADKDSPLVQIGGPGRVIVDFDTAALFEKPDGRPHVVGAVGGPEKDDGHSSGFLLEGFERLREPIISLRDQYIGNPSKEPLTVIGRSLDGMPVSVTDVRGVFSIRRQHPHGIAAAGADPPFPFRARDIESLIYNQTVPVLTAGEFPSGVPGDWTVAMHVLIHESLREFMSQYRLAEYLAGVGAHEAERSEYRADTILTKALQISSEVPDTLAPRATVAPKFRSRSELSGKFKKYGSEFSTRAQELGLELHWIGVGTWKIPDEASEATVSGKNVEAWRMSRENAQRSDPEALESLAQSALGDHKLRLIQEVPIARHQKNRARYTDKLVLMECLLKDFWEQLGDALDIHYRNGSPPGDVRELEDAVLKLEHLLRVSQIGHVIGGGTLSRVRKPSEWKVSQDGPPAPESRAEAAQYQLLLGKLQGDYRVAEAMIANERRRHGDLTREQLIARIVQRFERHGR